MVATVLVRLILGQEASLALKSSVTFYLLFITNPLFCKFYIYLQCHCNLFNRQSKSAKGNRTLFLCKSFAFRNARFNTGLVLSFSQFPFFLFFVIFKNTHRNAEVL